MTNHHIARLAAAGVVVTSGWFITAGTAHAATPRDTGCPAGYKSLSVTWLEGQGPYQLPRRLDEAGNNDGYVCGKAFNDAATAGYCGGSCPVPVLYDFIENDLTPGFKS